MKITELTGGLVKLIISTRVLTLFVLRAKRHLKQKMEHKPLCLDHLMVTCSTNDVRRFVSGNIRTWFTALGLILSAVILHLN